jgi:hypothetical protein
MCIVAVVAELNSVWGGEGTWVWAYSFIHSVAAYTPAWANLHEFERNKRSLVHGSAKALDLRLGQNTIVACTLCSD